MLRHMSGDQVKLLVRRDLAVLKVDLTIAIHDGA